MADNAVGYPEPSAELSRPGWGAAVEDLQWYALYTCSRHEKIVHLQLTAKAIESYLPLYTSLRHWNDRSAVVELPLFPGYLFVRMALSARLRVLTVPGVVRLVGFNGKLATLAEEEIQAIRTAVALHVAEPCAYLVEGQRIRITNGPLKGLEGIVTRRKGKLRAVVSVHSIMQSFSVEVDAADTQPIP
jgi:transcription antitermination factor NusG